MDTKVDHGYIKNAPLSQKDDISIYQVLLDLLIFDVDSYGGSFWLENYRWVSIAVEVDNALNSSFFLCLEIKVQLRSQNWGKKMSCY